MTNDRFTNYYIDLIHKELRRLKDGVLDNPSLTIEELRRTQGIYEGLNQALDLLKDSIEATDV